MPTVFNTAGGGSAIKADELFVAGAPPSRARGMVCFTWDDGYASWSTIAAQAKARGQRHTFCVTTNRFNPTPTNMITAADLQAWYADGHEIASHSVTHTNMGSAVQSTRITEFDDSKTYLESLVGAGNVRSFAYPYGSNGSPAGRDLTSDRMGYLRFDRLLDTGSFGIYDMTERSPFIIERLSWDETSHATVLALIRLAAIKPVVVCLYSHDVYPGIGPTLAHITEGLDLCQSLGVPAVTTAEAFPRSGFLVNAGFEDGLTGWTAINSGANTVEVVTDTPDAGINGTKSLHIACLDTGSAGAKQLIPVKPGREYKFGGRLRSGNGQVPTSGHAYLRLVAVDHAGVETGVVVSSTAEITSTTWGRQGLTYSVPASSTKYLVAQIRVQGEVGLELYADHMWFDETGHGDLW